MEYRTTLLPFTVALLCFQPLARAQQQDPVVLSWMQGHREQLGLSEKDAAQWEVTSASTNRRGDHFVYIRQLVNGLPVQGAVANFAVRKGQVVSFGDRLIRNVASGAPAKVPGISATDALRQAAKQLGLVAQGVRVINSKGPNAVTLSPSGISESSIPAQLIYQPVTTGGLRLAWDLTIRSNTTAHWWHLAVDAASGKIIRTNDYTVDCKLSNGSFPRASAPDYAQEEGPMDDGSAYRVFALPVEAPSFGPRTLQEDPADPDASPYGWHDTNGSTGAEYTITRGNNVYASEDINDDDEPGYSPDGGATLNFDFPYTVPGTPADNLDAAITNLFYTCNVLHDIWYQYGFDEASGNFQEDNYSGDGDGGDAVQADAQDGGGTNNANFSAPPDGMSGRMQMYIWNSGEPDSTLIVNSPAVVAGDYANEPAGFGPPLPNPPITADVVLAQDDAAPATDACDNITNAAALAGKIALVDRGTCTFVSKVLQMQDAGALAVIVINNVGGGAITMGGFDASITIPSVMISESDGAALKDALESGAVNATLQDGSSVNDKDGDLDNGVIAHEYGHGVSIRLTGGAADSDCLSNDEQMGEGWSDWMALSLTMLPGDEGTDARGIGTYVIDEPVDGTGIRPAPYSTDFAVNDYTYGSTNNQFALSEEHGIGFVWATMVWDMTWALVDAHGFDTDMYHGTGGNNIAMQIVIDGFKLQPCDPGFVDGRNAILKADSLDYGAADACTIWNAFARRGLGYSADEGDPFSRLDQTEAFDIPPVCIGVHVAEIHPGSAPALTLVPNPASNEVSLVFANAAQSDLTLKLFTADGRLVRSAVIGAGLTSTKLDLAGLVPATYLLKVRGAGATWNKRLVVVR